VPTAYITQTKFDRYWNGDNSYLWLYAVLLYYSAAKLPRIVWLDVFCLHPSSLVDWELGNMMVRHSGPTCFLPLDSWTDLVQSDQHINGSWHTSNLQTFSADLLVWKPEPIFYIWNEITLQLRSCSLALTVTFITRLDAILRIFHCLSKNMIMQNMGTREKF
jgi:hypothetical protein